MVTKLLVLFLILITILTIGYISYNDIQQKKVSDSTQIMYVDNDMSWDNAVQTGQIFSDLSQVLNVTPIIIGN